MGLTRSEHDWAWLRSLRCGVHICAKRRPIRSEVESDEWRLWGRVVNLPHPTRVSRLVLAWSGRPLRAQGECS